MKNLIQQISIVLLGCFAVSANAKPITQSFKTVAVTDNSVQLTRLETIGVNTSAQTMDSTQLKIMGMSQSQVFADVADDAGLINSAMGTRPVLITQAMTQPVVSVAIEFNPGASGGMPGAAPTNNVLVPEPPMLLLLGLGLIIAGVRRKG